MTTAAERTVRIPDESRLVFIPKEDGSRKVYVMQQDRIVYIERQSSSSDRTVYASEV